MTSPREQAIEAVAGRHYGTPASVRAIIDDYERTRARLDGAKMMPREATEEMWLAGAECLGIGGDTVCRIYRAMHDATPKDGER